MKAPDNQAGIITEKIMARVKLRLPGLTTDQYNPIWESVLTVLTMELQESRDVIKFPQGGGMFINRKR